MPWQEWMYWVMAIKSGVRSSRIGGMTVSIHKCFSRNFVTNWRKEIEQ